MTRFSRDERVLRWVHVEPGGLDVAPAEPSDAELVERAAKHLACRHYGCDDGDPRTPFPTPRDALAPTVITTVLGPRWIDLCLDCAQDLARLIGETCARPGCDKAAPPDRSRGGWCPWCCGRLHSTIVKADQLRLDLLAALVPSSQAGGSPVSGSKEPPAPLRVGLLSTAESLTSAMAEAEDLLRQQGRDGRSERVSHDRYGLPHPVPAATRFAKSRAYVLARWLELLDTDDGRRMGSHLLSLLGAGNRALGRDTLVHRLDAPCPSCNALSLRRHDGSNRVVCEVCGRTETEETYEWLTRAAVDAARLGAFDRVGVPAVADGETLAS